MKELGKLLLFTGFFLFLMGVLLILLERLPFGLGRLPGDIIIKKDGFTFYFPLATSIILSVVLSIILTLVFILLRR